LKQGTVASVLNARLLDEIANAALKVDHLIDPKRPYISDNLHIYLTLSNLRGVQYKVQFTGDDYHMIAHGDRVHYAVTEVGSWKTSSWFADGDKQRGLSACGSKRRRGLRVHTDGVLDSGAKRNAVKRSGFERPFQARQVRLGMAS
jgi:hypothetical protein